MKETVRVGIVGSRSITDEEYERDFETKVKIYWL